MKFKPNIMFGLFCIFILNTKSYSQDNYNMWFQYLFSAKLEKSNLTVISQYRSYDLATDSRLFLISAYYDYEIKNNLRPAVGIMYLVLNPYINEYEKKTRNEIRPFQQITYDFNINTASFSNRFRIEERFLNNPDVFILRARYLLSVRIPFNLDSKQSYYGIVKNEIRLNLKNDGFFDSDRITLGLGFKLSPKSNVEIAYINQLELKNTNHYAYIGFRNSVDWRKNK